jgi:hypothetical protein
MTSSQEVGWGTPNNGSQTHALIWTGLSASAVDLNPAGFTSSNAYGIYGNLVGGMGTSSSTGGNEHALLWDLSAGTSSDLNPNTYLSSDINSIYGTQEAGYADSSTGNAQAMIWNGTAASAVNLNPQGFTYSRAESTIGAEQVGFASTASNQLHAFVWSDSAASGIDLDQFLPSGYTSGVAYSINSFGDIVGIASDSANNSFAVEWIPTTPLPEPSIAMILLMISNSALLCRRPRRSASKK